MSRRFLGSVAAPALAVLLTACPASTPNGGTPTPSAGSLEAAAAEYEGLADEFNARNAELNELFAENQTLPELQEVLGEVVELDEEFLDRLREIDFPDELSDEVADLRVAVEDQLDVNRQLIAAENFREYIAIVQQAQPIFFAVSEAANELRRGLGLDPAPTLDLPSGAPRPSVAPSPSD